MTNRHAFGVGRRRTASGLRSLATSRGASPLALSSVAFSVSMALCAPLHAQAQQTLEEVTVTGTRIQRTSGFATPVPVTAVTPEELTSFQPSSTIADQLDVLPQFFGTQSAQRGGGALFGSAGGSYLNMRAMGPQRTLILLDGARVSPADRNGNVNVDNFPTALLQNVEVVTGGASAAYGADALAGVTNFVLNRNYTGLDLSLRAGRTDVGDGDNYNLSIAGGTELGDRWHFIGSVEDQRIDQIERNPEELGDWFRRWGYVQNPAWTGDTSQPQRLVLPDVHSTVHTPTGRIAGGYNIDPLTLQQTPTATGLAGYTFTYDGSAIRPFRPGDVVSPPGGTGSQSGGPEATIANQAFNGGPYGAEVERRNVFAGLTFDANDSTRFFINLLAGTTESNQNDRRNIPHLTAPWWGTIYRENPFLPDSVREVMFAEDIEAIRIEKQGTVLGQTGNYSDHEYQHNQFDTWTLTLGVDKELGDNWNLQARVQRGATDKYTTVYNELRVDREFLAMDAVSVDPVTGELLGDEPGEDPSLGVIMCNVQRYNPTEEQLRAAVEGYLVPAPQGDASLGGPEDRVPIPGPVGPDNAIRDCVPMNVLGQGNVSPEAAAYVVSPKAGASAVTQEFAEVLLTGDIWQGYGPGPFSMAAGLTYREQWFWQRGLPVDLMAYGPPRNAPDIGIRGFPPGFEGGSANLHEFSTVPVIGGGYDVWEAFAEFNLPLWESDSGAQRFELDLAGRHSDYSTSGGIVSHKTGINFQLVEPFRLRATVSRDVREPTFSERFDLQGGGGNVNDPLSTPVPNRNFEITVTTGGNPSLEPEEADTVTAGFVYQPNRIEGLQFSMDWYEIDLSGAVGTLGQQRIVDECVAGALDLCALVIRDPANNEIQNVKNVFLNIDQAKVRGIDYELLFNAEPDFLSDMSESLSVRLLAGRLLEDSTTVISGTTEDLAGQYTEPDFTALATVRYQAGSFGVNLQQRYIAESVIDVDFVEWEPGIVVPPGTITVDNNTVPSKTYTDLTLLYDAELSGGTSFRTSLTVTNLFDRDPPVIPSFGQRFSAQGVSANNYDMYGRRYSLNFNYRF